MKQVTAAFIALVIVDTSSVAYSQIVDGCIFRQVRWSRNILEKGANASAEACALACSTPAGPTMVSIGGAYGGQAPCRGWQYIIPGGLGSGMGGVCTIISWPDEYPPVVERSLISVCSGGGALPIKPIAKPVPPPVIVPAPVAPAVTVVPRPPRVAALPPRVHAVPPRVHAVPPRIHVQRPPRIHSPRVQRIHTVPPRIRTAHTQRPRVHVNRVPRVQTNPHRKHTR